MAITDPVKAYTAANSIEASVVRDLLIDAEVEAFVLEDVSPAGYWMGGLIGNIHKPTVVVNRADAERAAPVVQAFDAEVVARERAKHVIDESQADIRVVCEDCGGISFFPAARRGGIEQCAHCREYVDVEDENSTGAGAGTDSDFEGE